MSKNITNDSNELDDYKVYIPRKKRALAGGKYVKGSNTNEYENEQKDKPSLLDRHIAQKSENYDAEGADDFFPYREYKLGDVPLDQPVGYVRTSWTPPKYLRYFTFKDVEKFQLSNEIVISGNELPPFITSFTEMKLNHVLISALQQKKILKPTAIQIQCIPALLSGRDVIGVANTGCGKTLAYILPMVMFALEQEVKLPVKVNEGPLALVIVPSRELARQINEILNFLLKKLGRYYDVKMRSVLCIGGESYSSNCNDLTLSVCHFVVGTPGRLIDLLKKSNLNSSMCSFVVLDEADRMVDAKFEEEITSILSFFKHRFQFCAFSTSYSEQIYQFSSSKLKLEPLVINVGKQSTGCVNIRQKILLVNEEDLSLQLLLALQSTPPPTLIFAMKKADVDSIHEFLLLKKVEAVAIHGEKEHKDRIDSFNDFRTGKKDVLVITDIAAKGLDFSNVEHVISIDLPPDLDSHCQRICKTKKTTNKDDQNPPPLATTFVTKSSEVTILFDIRELLRECKQKIPDFLNVVCNSESPESTLRLYTIVCNYCKKSSHRLINCPLLISQQETPINKHF